MLVRVTFDVRWIGGALVVLDAVAFWTHSAMPTLLGLGYGASAIVQSLALTIYAREGFCHHRWSPTLALMSEQGLASLVAVFGNERGALMLRTGEFPRCAEIPLSVLLESSKSIKPVCWARTSSIIRKSTSARSSIAKGQASPDATNPKENRVEWRRSRVLTRLFNATSEAKTGSKSAAANKL
ncbi:MAG: hypothetical protein CMO26_17590 [Thiotrichales bacterium]|nr:hypothetical protein [Thiotrichales bacterium]